MTDEPLSVSVMQANVLRSRGHVAKQEGIIHRLTAQGHEEMAREAAALLDTMKGHLEIEVVMLARMEAATGP